MPYFNPHSFRDTLVQLGERVCPNIEAFKAWSQNLGHANAMTTLTSYDTLQPHRQAELIRGIGAAQSAPVLDPAANDLDPVEREIAVRRLVTSAERKAPPMSLPICLCYK